MRDKKNYQKINWVAVGAIVLILLLLLWFMVVDSDGDPNNGFITPLIGDACL